MKNYRIRIIYPPNTSTECDFRSLDKWPKNQFKWINGLMKQSEMRIDVSPEILQYHAYLLGDANIYPFQTRNILVIKTILNFLIAYADIAFESTLLELCAGTGIITTPLAHYFDIIAFEKNARFVSTYNAYVSKFLRGQKKINNHVHFYTGDITVPKTIFEKIDQQRIEAAVLNPPFNLIPEAFAIVDNLIRRPKIVVAILPLDLIAETERSYSYRRLEKINTVERDILFMKSFRERWNLVAIEPLVRKDGSADIGTFLFQIQD